MAQPIQTTRFRVDAKPFAEEIDARIAVMEYCDGKDIPSSAFSLREYRGEGFYVFVMIGNGDWFWLTR